MSGGLKTRLKTGIPENVSNRRGRPEPFYFCRTERTQEPMKASKSLRAPLVDSKKYMRLAWSSLLSACVCVIQHSEVGSKELCNCQRSDYYLLPDASLAADAITVYSQFANTHSPAIAIFVGTADTCELADRVSRGLSIELGIGICGNLRHIVSMFQPSPAKVIAYKDTIGTDSLLGERKPDSSKTSPSSP